jgi:hypothetical protein
MDAQPERSQHEETLKAVQMLAASKGDSFRVRISRKKTVASVPDPVAAFDGVTSDHLITPETWMPDVAGGGYFLLTVYHESDGVSSVGAPISLTVPGEPRDVDPITLQALVISKNWRGPKSLLSPKPIKTLSPTPAWPTGLSVPSPGGSGTVPRNTDPTTPPGGGPSHADPYLLDVARRERELALREKQLEIDAIRREAEARVKAAEDRAAAEATRANDRMDRLEQRMLEKPHSDDVGTALARAAESVGKMLIEFKQADREQARIKADADVRIAEAQAKANADVLAARARADEAAAAAQRELVTAMLKRPPIDPALLPLLTRDDGAAAAMKNVVEATGSMSSMLINAVSAMADMRQGQEGEGGSEVIAAVRDGIRALVTMTRKTNSSFQGRQPAQQIPPAQRPHRVPPAKQPAPNGANGSNGSTTPTPTSPNVAAQPAQPVQASEPVAIDRIVNAIKAKTVPPKALAFEIFRLLAEDEQFAGLLASMDFNPGVLFRTYLSDWMEADAANRRYVKTVVAEVIRTGIDKGLMDKSLGAQVDKMLAEPDDAPMIGEEDEAEFDDAAEEDGEVDDRPDEVM